MTSTDRTNSPTPVILLHSSGFSGRQWRKLAAAIVDGGGSAVAPDLTGHGTSPLWPEPQPFNYRVDVDNIVALLERTGPAALVGHSYGGFLAMHVALAAPERVRSLVLYDPVAFGVLDPVADADVAAGLYALDLSPALPHERWLQNFVDYWGGPGAWNGLRDDVRAEFRRTAWVVREGVRSLMEDRTPLSTFVNAFRFPVQLMTGAQSPIAAQTVIARLASAVPGARKHVVEGAGHLAPVTHADRVNPVILAALSRVSSDALGR